MDINSSQFILVIIFIGILLILCPCRGQADGYTLRGGRPLKGGLSKGQECGNNGTPCKKGLACLQGKCA